MLCQISFINIWFSRKVLNHFSSKLLRRSLNLLHFSSNFHLIRFFDIVPHRSQSLKLILTLKLNMSGQWVRLWLCFLHISLRACLLRRKSSKIRPLLRKVSLDQLRSVLNFRSTYPTTPPTQFVSRLL